MTKNVTTAEWKTVRLDECFDIQQGKQVSKKYRAGNNQRPFLRTSNILWGRLNLLDLDQMDFTADEEKRFALHKGDLLVCEGGDIGRTAMWNGNLERCYYQNHLHRLRKLNGQIDEGYTLLFLQYAFVYAKLYFGRANVTTIPNLSKSRLGELEISLPPLIEQQHIAKTLTTVQGAISAQEELIANLKKLKQSMMQHLFAHGTRKEQIVASEIGEIPVSWRVEKLGDIVNFTTGKLNSNAMEPDGSYPFFTCSQDDYRINSYAFDCEALLLSGNNAKAVYSVKYYKGKFNAYQRTYVITLKNNHDSYSFMRYMLEMNLSRLQSISIGTSTKYLTLGLLANLLVGKPDYEEQKKIGLVLDRINIRIESAQKKLSTYQNLFKTLLHELMSGKRRIKN